MRLLDGPVPKSWGNMEYRETLIEIIKVLRPHTYVEIGVRKGYTFNAVSRYVTKAYAIDIAPMPKIKQGNNIKKIRGDSKDIAKTWKLPIDLLFIDADHRKESVLADFNGFSPFVREGTGIIVLHDTHPSYTPLLKDNRCSNAWEAAWEIRSNDTYKDFEIFTFPGPYAGLSLIRKSKKQLAYDLL